MKEQDKYALVAGLAGLLMGFMLTFIIVQDYYRTEAVLHGAAEWKADHAGRAEWVWKK